MDAALAGLITGLSLIVAIGAQNAYVLRLGLAREHVALAVG
ncbi:MAG: amino acid transporter, partial [Actinomycetota bacterium]